jgi:hypothetical protein
MLQKEAKDFSKDSRMPDSIARNQKFIGLVTESDTHQALVQTQDGAMIKAIIPHRWFSSRGGFDMCRCLPTGLRVGGVVRKAPKQNKLTRFFRD